MLCLAANPTLKPVFPNKNWSSEPEGAGERPVGNTIGFRRRKAKGAFNNDLFRLWENDFFYEISIHQKEKTATREG